MSHRSLARPGVHDDAEALAKAAVLADAAAGLLWDAARYVRETKAMNATPDTGERALNYDLCRASDKAEKLASDAAQLAAKARK